MSWGPLLVLFCRLDEYIYVVGVQTVVKLGKLSQGIEGRRSPRERFSTLGAILRCRSHSPGQYRRLAQIASNFRTARGTLRNRLRAAFAAVRSVVRRAFEAVRKYVTVLADEHRVVVVCAHFATSDPASQFFKSFKAFSKASSSRRIASTKSFAA